MGSISRPVDVFNGTAVASGTSLITAGNITPSEPASKIDINLVLDTTTVLELLETDGTTTYLHELNNGVAFTANRLYGFTIEVSGTLSYNLRHRDSGNVALKSCKFTEVFGGGR